RALLESLFMDLTAAGTLRIGEASTAKLAADCAMWSRRSLCHCLLVGVAPTPLQVECVRTSRLRIAGPRPALGDETEEPEILAGEDAVEAWAKALEEVLRRWV